MSEKYYNSYDRCFVADPFEATFTRLDGNLITDTVSGASIDIVVFQVDRYTREPIYDVNNGDEAIETGNEFAKCFSVSVNAELGVVVVPDAYGLAQYADENPSKELACKITGYTIETGVGFLASDPVSESEFKRIVCGNFSNFNNSTNFDGQHTAYGYHKVQAHHTRSCFHVGYDRDRKAIYVPCGPRKKEVTYFFSVCKTEEQAKEMVSMLEKVTPEEMRNAIFDDRKRTIDLLKELARQRGWKSHV